MPTPPLRIAQIAPLVESVPPQLYGGTERIVSYLTEALVSAGHDVTLFASGDSVTGARLERACRRATRLDTDGPDDYSLQIAMLENVMRKAPTFDVLHFHTAPVHFPFARRCTAPSLTTLHGRLDLPGHIVLFREYRDLHLVSVSNAQRRPVEPANWRGTVYHGLPLERLTLSEAPGRYFAFLGRISPEKRVDRAIDVARLTGIPLKIAAKVDRIDREYYEARIRPLIDGSHVEYIGEIAEHEKSEFLGGAIALLFLIDWPEPFGLAMIESMACGTPVIAASRGSVPEVVDEGVTGYIVDSVEDAAARCEDAMRLSRRRCRETFERRFSAQRMAADYGALYEELRGGEWRRTA